MTHHIRIKHWPVAVNPLHCPSHLALRLGTQFLFARDSLSFWRPSFPALPNRESGGVLGSQVTRLPATAPVFTLGELLHSRPDRGRASARYITGREVDRVIGGWVLVADHGPSLTALGQRPRAEMTLLGGPSTARSQRASSPVC